MTTTTSTLTGALAAALFLSLASTVPCQQGLEVKLRAESEFVSATGSAKLSLSVFVKEDTKVPAALLSGLQIKTTVNGKAGPTLRRPASGTIKLTKGTRLVRPLSIDMNRVLASFKDSGIARVTFEWIGIEGVSTVVQVAPDLKGVDIETFDLAKTRVTLLTNYGEMELKFYPDKAPNTVKNFIKLAKNGFYDTSGFHRVIPGFMIQGGCPNSKPGAEGVAGTGSPGYKIKAEFNDIRHVRGVISMARSSHPDSAGCQFFICHAPASNLDDKYTGFGELVKGHDVLDKIASVACNGSKPVEPVRIKKMVVKPVFKKDSKK